MSILSSNNAEPRITKGFLERRGYDIDIDNRWVVYHFTRVNQGNWFTPDGYAIFYIHNPIREGDELHLCAWLDGHRFDINRIEDLVRVEEYYKNL